MEISQAISAQVFFRRRELAIRSKNGLSFEWNGRLPTGILLLELRLIDGADRKLKGVEVSTFFNVNFSTSFNAFQLT